VKNNLLKINDDGQYEIVDRIKFSNWLNSPELIHTNKLDYYNKYVQQAIEKFNNVDPFKVYNFVRVYYWQYCSDFAEFEKDIKDKLDNIKNLDELFVNVT